MKRTEDITICYNSIAKLNVISFGLCLLYVRDLFWNRPLSAWHEAVLVISVHLQHNTDLSSIESFFGDVTAMSPTAVHCEMHK